MDIYRVLHSKEAKCTSFLVTMWHFSKMNLYAKHLSINKLQSIEIIQRIFSDQSEIILEINFFHLEDFGDSFICLLCLSVCFP